jgi:ketosteroid isomerase-like protein
MSDETASVDFDQVIEQNHLALDEFAKGNHASLERLYSQRDDVTLGNPFGPFVRGFEHVVQTMQRAASYYRDGEATGFDLVSKHVTPDIAYIVEVERYKAKMGGRNEISTLSLRVTSVFRREGGAWRLVHRHADPITTARPAESVIQK